MSFSFYRELQGQCQQAMAPRSNSETEVAEQSRHPLKDESPPFLCLPAEIRNEIYDLLLTAPELASVKRQLNTTRTHMYDHEFPLRDLHPSILATCKQIYHEASPILYRRHTFTAHPRLLTGLPYLVVPQKPITSSDASSRIKRWSVSVRLDTDPGYTAADLAAAFSGAELLEIDVWQAQFEASDYSVLRLFEEIRGVHVARVTGSVERGFASWLEDVMMMPEGDEASTPAYVEREGEDGRRTARGPAGLPLWKLGEVVA